MSLHSFSEWLGGTPLSLVIQNTTWIIPAVQSVHILSIAVVISCAAIFDLKVLGLIGRGQPTGAYASRFLTWIWYAVIVLAVSGAILITGEPSRSLENPAFQLKMLLLILAMIGTFVLQRPLKGDPAFWELNDNRKLISKGVAILTLAFWIGIIFCGRWIAYISVNE